MNEFFLSAYVLVWPIIATGILLMLIKAVVKDCRDARKAGGKVV